MKHPKLPEHKLFHGVHGKKAETLSDLKEMIKELSDNSFSHHTKHGNDFANWTRHILHRDYLADRMERVHSRHEMIELIEDELSKDRHTDIDSTDEFKRFIAKEFIYGMIFGIIIGIIISRLI